MQRWDKALKCGSLVGHDGLPEGGAMAIDECNYLYWFYWVRCMTMLVIQSSTLHPVS